MKTIQEKEYYGQRINFYWHEYETLDEQHKKILNDWVTENLKPYKIKTYNYRHSSYGLKHWVENIIGFYISNADMKVALAKAGFKAQFRSLDANGYYQISERFYNDYFNK